MGNATGCSIRVPYGRLPPSEEHRAMSPQLTPDELRQIRAYEAPTLTLVRELTAAMRRGARHLALIDERGTDPVWRAEVAAEYRGWRGYLDSLPEESPAAYAMAHARILRWAAAVAEAGDDYAAAVLDLDDERLRLASRKMAATLDLYVLASEAAAEAVRRLRS